MARSRLDLQEKLETLEEGIQAYFQPPDNIILSYPCIIYNLSSRTSTHADNGRYQLLRSYNVTIITEDADSDLPDKMEELFPKYCSFDRVFTSDNLYHYVYTIFY